MTKRNRLQKNKGIHQWIKRFLLGGATLLAIVGAFMVYNYFTSDRTSAAAGDFAVYRQATATSSITTTPTILQWDQTVEEGLGFSIDGGRTDITLEEAGHYLVMYNVAYDTTSTANQRSEMQANLILGGEDQAHGRGSCYVRRQTGTFECWLSAAAVIEATTTNSILEVETFRTDTAGADINTRPNESGLMILRLDDDWDYARIQDSTGNQTVNATTFADINLDQNDELDAGTFSRSGSDITLADAGKYLVTANVMFQNSTTGSRRTNMMRLTLDGYELPGTRVNTYIRGSNSSQNHAAGYVGIIDATTTNQILNLEAACDSLVCGNITTIGGEVGITITKLPDTVELVRLTELDTTSEQTVDGTNDGITWDTQDEIDSAFSHSTSTNSSRITVQEDGDYLFFSSFYTDRITSTSDGNRLYPHWEWAVNGTVQQYGSFGRFNRGDQSTTDAFRAGNSGGMIFNNLSSGDYVEVQNTDEGTVNDNGATFQGGFLGIQGLLIDSLIPPDITVASVGSQTATTTIPTDDFHVGGSFSLAATNGNTRTVTDITITASGTADLQNDIDDIRLFYEADTSAPYDCSSESYSGVGETQFGAIDVNGFSAAGTSTFSSSVMIGTTSTMCLYVIIDGASELSDGETISVYINDPSTDIVIDSGKVRPKESFVKPSGLTTFQTEVITQTHYHWRDDDGSEAAASSATGGTEDTVLTQIPVNQEQRIRIQLSNEGSLDSASTTPRLEVAEAAGTCSAATGWTDVGASGGTWDMFDSPNLTHGNDTTNIGTSTGGVTDENTTFITPNSGLRDTDSYAPTTTIASTEFIEYEYSVISTLSASEGTTYCFRLTDNGTEYPQYDVYPEIALGANVLVSATGTQIIGIDKDTDDIYVGGTFVVQEQDASRDVTSITITASGTLDTANDVNDSRLFYDLDTSSPYNCASETFDGVGTDTQYGSSNLFGFSAAGTSTFTDTVTISTTSALCLYVVMDVDADAGNGETFDIEINNPKNDVVLSSGTLGPNTPVAIDGVSTINGAVMNQEAYHWRHDDGSESGATSATAGVENSAIARLAKGSTRRLRFGLDNEGIATSTARQMRLEYGTLSSTCSAIASWTDVGAAGGAWDMSESGNLTDGDDTTNIAIADGGVTDLGPTFQTPNASVKDLSSQTSGVLVGPDDFLELEYSIEATDFAADSTTYCFRLTDAGAPLETYTVYPQATTRPIQDFYIQRGVVTIGTGTTTESIIAGSDYAVPDPTRAFIRITNTHHTGAGDDVGGGTQQADDVTAYILNPDNLENGITFERAGTTDNTRVAWEIIEYIGPDGGGNEMIVHEVDTIDFGTGDLSTSTAVSGVTDDNDVVVFITGSQNPNAGTGSYNVGLATANWNATTSEAEFVRAETDSIAVSHSYAVVEFTGAHWFIQRIEHPYGTDTDEIETLPTAVSSSTTFLHVQKRVGSNDGQLEEFGQEVYLNDAGTQLTFRLETGADNPTGHTGVAWVIENQQTGGTPMVVERSTGTQTGGSEPATVNVGIGRTISALDNASIFIVNRVTGTGSAHPRAMISARLISTTQYEIWISDTGQTRTYRTEVVDWPTAAREIVQNYYRFYVDNDALDPTDPWPVGGTDLGENTAITATDEPIEPLQNVRIRMSLQMRDGSLSAGAKQYKLQSGERVTTCSAVSAWTDVGAAGSGSSDWIGVNITPTDGTSLSTNPAVAADLNLSVSDRAGSFERENNSISNPYKVALGEDVEYDWVVRRGTADDSTFYCFRMVESNGTVLDGYDFYPTLLTGGFAINSLDWRWYDDEETITPVVPMAATNTAPQVGRNDPLKLRMVFEEFLGSSGATKFKLQYSDTSDFSGNVFDVVDQDECNVSSIWCYADGAGNEHATITASVLGSADACSGATGDGCGTHNEYSYVPTVIGEVGTSSTDSSGTTINLDHTYSDPVFIIESISGDNAGPASNEPAAAKITATTSNSFTVVIDEPDDEDGTHSTESFAYMVMERGAHTLPDGTRIDVGSLSTSNFYSNTVSGSDATCSFGQSFTAPPVVISALQTNNNASSPDFFTVSGHSVTSSQFSCAIEMPDGSSGTPSSPETIGWIAIEGGTFTNHSIPFEVGTTTVSVLGWTDTWYEHAFATTTPSAPGILASKQTRNGGEGGWVRYDAITATSAQFAIDEADGSTSRGHAAESVGYVSFARSGRIYTETLATSTMAADASTEFEWTIRHNIERFGETYFFRAYDIIRDAPVTASTTFTNPSAVTESGAITFIVGGVDAGISTGGIITDATSTATSVPFGDVSPDVEYEIAQRLDVTSNALGYTVFLNEGQDLINGSGSEIFDVAASNTAPLAWNSACTIPLVTGCWGYHTTDSILSGGSTRFAADDTYAEISTTPEEVVFSSLPVTNEQTDIIYKLEIDPRHPEGLYSSTLQYVIVPVF